MADPAVRVSAAFEPDLAALQAQVQPVLIARGGRLTRAIANEARSRVPVRTGYLGRSIREEPVTMVGPFIAETGVTATAPYAAAVERGTRPHLIRPRNGNVLAFPGAGGTTVFAREVQHPGTAPRPFLQSSAEYVVSSEQ